jgi:hypothetical protein
MLPSIAPLLQWGLPFLVTIGALFVGWRQLGISKKQIRLQHREKRLVVHDAVMTLIARAVQKGTVTPEEWQKFARDTKEVAFLFDKRIAEYCKEIYNHAVDVSVAHYVMETATSSPNYKQCVEKWNAGMKWFNEQDKEAEKLFKSYLRVTD